MDNFSGNTFASWLGFIARRIDDDYIFHSLLLKDENLLTFYLSDHVITGKIYWKLELKSSKYT